MEKKYKNTYNNIGYFFFILLAFVLLGFFKTYFGLFPTFNEKITNVIHLHALILMLWIALLIIQPMLIRFKKHSTHRFLGKSSYVLAPLVICSLISLMFKHYDDVHMQTWSLLDIAKSFYFQIIHTVIFAVFYLLAMINKRNVSLHAGYMIATGLVFINPSLTRLLLFWFNIPYPITETIVICFIDAVILFLLFFARSRKLNYKLYVVILFMFLLYHIPMLIKLWV